MVYVTGDCHADFSRFSTDNFPEQNDMTRNDTVIVCGDFGGVWDYEKSGKQEKWWLDWLADKPFTIAFVDGNHENFDRLFNEKEFEPIPWNGGMVHRIRDNVFHMIRGYVYRIDGKRFWAFGGASSHDISDGILDENDFRTKEDFKKRLRQMSQENKMFRVNHKSWWEQEMPTQMEMNFGSQQLDACDNEVDFIVTHCAPQNIVAMVSGGAYQADALTSYFDVISESVRFNRWFFGHYHSNAQIMGGYVMLYQQLVRVL